MERLTGIGVSQGTAMGPALVAIQRTQVIRFPISRDRVARELAALDRAQRRSRDQLVQIRNRLAETKGAELAAIFDAQLLMLEDPSVIGRAATVVREGHVNAEWAVQCAIDEAEQVFGGIDDPYLRERKGDLHDVAGRLRMNLREGRDAGGDPLQDLDAPCVLIADELTPSVVAQLDWTYIKGFATDAGSRTYHTAILARSLGVPAVVGLHDVSARVPTGASVLIDGETGEVIIDPPPALCEEAARRSVVAVSGVATQGAPRGPLTTADGVGVVLQANIERIDDVSVARDVGAEGIGLYRSEFMLGGGTPGMASEEEQYHVYRQLAERMSPHAVTIRTFDIDAEQLGRPPTASSLDTRWFQDHERASSAGLRGIRFGLAHPDIFKAQLRALLRAAQHGPVQILFPFVSSVQEVRDARVVLAEAASELRDRGVTTPAVPVGIMIEVPSAAVTASLLAREADFFTIGTNDLIQYTLAVDRTDDRVSHRYEPLHPAVLRLMRQVRRAAGRRGIPVAVCGEMAADPLLIRLLIGFGLRVFSMTPGAVPVARRIVQDTDAGAWGRLAARVLTLATVGEIEEAVGMHLRVQEGEVRSGG